MNELKSKVKELLGSKEIDLFIGYEQGTRLPRPLLAASCEEADRLIFDEYCTGNLAVYLTRKDLVGGKKVGIAASYYAMRSISRLLDENQLQEGAVKIFGLPPDGAGLKVFETVAEVKQHLQEAPAPPKQVEDGWVKEIEEMPAAERWRFWASELSKCFRCYACRAACPMCYCTKCIVEVNRPQWVQPWAATASNMEWQINRVMHMAGRCADCGACGAACPLGLPVHIIAHKMVEMVTQNFGEPAGKGNVLSTFSPNDKENFIR
ncbi:MAG: 4Fe-4S dicluster domain-containing protein [Prevotellaceae bacterium]|jgi:ferredoxin|nr:4Fe-4S dicluster domain-containing protein [Prevotellaceae bacterium]